VTREIKKELETRVAANAYAPPFAVDQFSFNFRLSQKRTPLDDHVLVGVRLLKSALLLGAREENIRNCCGVPSPAPQHYNVLAVPCDPGNGWSEKESSAGY